jgi:hypothetical protein
MKNSIQAVLIKAAFFSVLATLWLAACSPEQQSSSLYEDIETGVAAIKATSHDQPGYQPVPDSLRLRFDKTLRALRVTVVTDGCEPRPQARVEESAGRLLVQFDMKNACVHVRAEFFDVDMLISPVHEDEFRLIVESSNFDNNVPGVIVLNQLVDVRKLPGVK